MPLYDYRCAACGREVEVMHGIHERGPATCEACGGAMSKVLSPPAIHFKGSGWAKKDAASAGKAKPKGPSSGSSSGNSEGKGESSGEGKGAAQGKGSGGDGAAAATSTATGTADASKG